jgi:hypothetical protein
MDFVNEGGSVYRVDNAPARCPFCGERMEIVHMGRDGIALDRYHGYSFQCLLRFQVYGIVGKDRRSIRSISNFVTVRMPNNKCGWDKWGNTGIVTEYELTITDVCYNTNIGFSTDRFDFGIF